MSDGKIFISYRRADTAYAARLLYDRFNARFGAERIFMDVEGLTPGVDFVETIETAVSSCDVLVALIGPQWLDVEDTRGGRRLDNSEDFVRLEIAAALERGIRVIPILVQDARMPGSRELPQVFERLSRLNALEIRHERFNADADRLARAIETYLKEDAERREREPAEQASRERAERQQRAVNFFQALPRRVLWGGLGLVVVLALACWGGNALLASLRGAESPKPTIVSPTPGIPMALVPAAEFLMGGSADDALAECQQLYEPFSDNECSRNWFTSEEPQHTVALDEYYMDQYEVTNTRYAECVDAGVCDPPSSSASYTRDNYYENEQYAEYPVIYVSWEAADTYCAWRGARLPSEAEWEKAARGGLEGQQYPWGDKFADGQANFCDSNCGFSQKNTDFDDGYEDTAPVGSYAPNGYGLYDMAGNVWEWAADWYDGDYYTNAPAENPTGPGSGNFRVLRGGSWGYLGYGLRVAYRFYDVPSSAYLDIGFRCARSP